MPNQEWRLTKHLKGEPQESDFGLAEVPEPQEADMKDGEILIELCAVSVDPYMRIAFSEQGSSYLPAVKLGSPLNGLGVAIVRKSKESSLKEGTHVMGFLQYTLRRICTKEGLNVIPVSESLPVAKFLGAMGMTGQSAYLPIEKLAHAKAGETCFVSGAAGAVGSVAVQLLKLKGCTVVGSAGSAEKVDFVKDLGADICFNYKEVPNTSEGLAEKLKELCPGGIDVYFDNVGGPMLDAVLLNMKKNGRIICCGAISQYNSTDAYGIKNLFMVITHSLRMSGFLVFDWAADMPAASEALSALVVSNKLKTRETIVEGFAKLPSAFLGLFKGENLGKMIVQV